MENLQCCSTSKIYFLLKEKVSYKNVAYQPGNVLKRGLILLNIAVLEKTFLLNIAVHDFIEFSPPY